MKSKILHIPQNNPFIQAIRNGLILAIPILMIGSFALIFMSFPVQGYQTFISTFCNGIFLSIFNFIHKATFGMLSVYMTLSISYCYVRQSRKKTSSLLGIPFTALAVFIIITGALSPDFSLSMLGPKGMFSAIFSAITSSFLYKKLTSFRNFGVRLYADGTDVTFNHAVSVILPSTIIIVIFALFNYLFASIFHVSGFHEFFILSANHLFQGMGCNYFSGLLFLLLSNTLWFLGIHGSNVLEGVSQSLFQPAIEINTAALAAGQVPTAILSKTFLDSFVVIGGCGTTFCLLISLLIFSKRRSNQNLAKLAAFPMCFNINEMMVFGLPVIYNQFLLPPFILAPVIIYTTSYFSMKWGLVPVASHEISWTTPALFSGFLATGSIRGAVLQVVNICLGVCIYIPFVRKYDQASKKVQYQYMEDLIQVLKQSEESTVPVVLTEQTTPAGALAKSLVGDLQQALEDKQFNMYYQPQFNAQRKCIGAEALLRWNHQTFGIIYPPLVIKLAGEANLKLPLEKLLLQKVAKDTRVIKDAIGGTYRSSVNITVSTLKSPGFENFLTQLLSEYKLNPGDLCLEITEETELTLDDETIALLGRIRQMGYKFALDDFSMGHTSLKYLQSNQFDEVKLDGSLVREIESNPRCKDIVDSILYLSHSLGFSVLAEYVETEEQRQVLENISCLEYQGYLFSPAIPLKNLLSMLTSL